jgi:hypothetical protein
MSVALLLSLVRGVRSADAWAAYTNTTKRWRRQDRRERDVR